jgi:hypothetical protein
MFALCSPAYRDEFTPVIERLTYSVRGALMSASKDHWIDDSSMAD